MKIGIIGLGAMGKHHLQCLLKNDSVTEIHVYFSSIKQEQPSFPKVKYHLIEDFSNHALDGVIIASPNHCHKDHILTTLAQRTPLLCEKPLCSTVDELNALLQEVNNLNLINVNFNYRFLPVIEAARKFFGKPCKQAIKSIELVFNKDSALYKTIVGWRESGQSGLSSGAFGDLGIHLIDMLYHLLQTPIRLSSLNLALDTRIKTRADQQIKVDDDARLTGKLVNGINFIIQASKSCDLQSKGFGITISGIQSSFHYHSTEPAIYKIIDDINVKVVKLTTVHNVDPNNEVHGWIDSIAHTHTAWITKIKTGIVNDKLATFDDAVRAQTLFFDAIDSRT